MYVYKSVTTVAPDRRPFAFPFELQIRFLSINEKGLSGVALVFGSRFYVTNNFNLIHDHGFFIVVILVQYIYFISRFVYPADMRQSYERRNEFVHFSYIKARIRRGKEVYNNINIERNLLIVPLHETLILSFIFLVVTHIAIHRGSWLKIPFGCKQENGIGRNHPDVSDKVSTKTPLGCFYISTSIYDRALFVNKIRLSESWCPPLFYSLLRSSFNKIFRIDWLKVISF